jgi:hypothetical protein
LSDFHDAIDRYEGYRLGVFDFVESALHTRVVDDNVYAALSGVHIRLGPITDAAARSWSATAQNPTFPWPTLQRQFSPYIDRFEVAVWGDGQVCGLAYGRPSKGAGNVTIHFVERVGGVNNPLKGYIIPIVADTATAYAHLLGKEAVKVKDPVPEAVASYMAVGFVPAPSIGRVTYLERRVVR